MRESVQYQTAISLKNIVQIKKKLDSLAGQVGPLIFLFFQQAKRSTFCIKDVCFSKQQQPLPFLNSIPFIFVSYL